MTNSIDRVEIITSVQRRRRWTASEKVRIVEECCYVPLLFSVRCLSLALHRHRSQRAPNTASTRRVTRERPCGRGPWLRASSPVRRQRTVAARTRIVSTAGIRLDPRKTARPFKGIFCDDISELKNGTAARDRLVSGAGRSSSSRQQWIGR